MQVYKVRDIEYKTICSVHGAMKKMILFPYIDGDTKQHILELLDVANDMAINMENALERKRDIGIGMFGFKEEDEE